MNDIHVPWYKKENGMTLVEVLIALSVFSIFIAMAIAGFTQLLRNQRLTLLMMEANDNVSSAIEQMSREIRTSDNFQCVGSPSPCSAFSFTDLQIGKTVSYQLSGTHLERSEGGTIFSPAPFYPITTSNPNIGITSFQATVQPTTPLRITLDIGIQVQDSNAGSFTTYLQTTISPRVYYHNN